MNWKQSMLLGNRRTLESSNMKTYNISFEVTKPIDDKDKYMVTCDEMDYSAWTNNPQEVIQGLVREWFDLDVGEETPDHYEHKL